MSIFSTVKKVDGCLCGGGVVLIMPRDSIPWYYRLSWPLTWWACSSGGNDSGWYFVVLQRRVAMNVMAL